MKRSSIRPVFGRNSVRYILLVVGAVSALGPFLTDFYLPGLPALGVYFGAAPSLVQMSLTVSMLGLAAGQLVFGPLSDKYGRKPPLLISLVLFVLSSAACVFAPTIGAFLLFRTVQGFAGAGGVVISKSIASDLYEGRSLTRFFALLAAVQGLAPICAPVLGGLLLAWIDWRGIFAVLALMGVALGTALCWFKESLSVERRSAAGVLATFGHYIPVLKNRSFLLFVAVQALAMGVMFTYIASSPFLFQTHYGISPFAYSLLFGVNAFAIMLGSFAVTRFKRTERALQWGVYGFFGAGVLAACALSMNASAVIVEAAFFVLLFFLGLVLPTSTALGLDLERCNSGIASALIGFAMFFAGGLVSPLTGIGDMRLMTAVLVVVCAAGTLLCARKAVDRMVPN